ncbi:MAG: double-strand break repair protein AddB [Parvibaculum sp.]
MSRAIDPTIFSMPAGTPFLDALATALIADTSLGGILSKEPVALGDITILLPTRRAVRALGEAFLRASAGRAVLLPYIRPLGDVDEEELLLTATERFEATGALDLPPTIDTMERQLLLTELVLKWGSDPKFLTGPKEAGQAALLAGELAQLIDNAETQGVDLDRLHQLVPDEFAEHWKLTLSFLQIALDNWPHILKERGLIDPAKRRNMSVRAQASAWAENPPAHPVLVAGSTGSIPATAELLKVIATLPEGAVLLPGLDFDLDDRGWDAVDAAHPQFGMKQLLSAMGVARDDVKPWPGEAVSAVSLARARLLNEALRPAETTDAWVRMDAGTVNIADAVSHFTYVEAPTPREEASIIATAFRELLETPGRTGILVTPDRSLARRVAAEMSRWQVPIDDSAGVPLAQTMSFGFLRLVLVAMEDELAPVALLDLLKHPLAALGLSPDDCRKLARRLERAVLRGPRPAPGLDGLADTLAKTNMEDPRREQLSAFLDRLERAIGPFSHLMNEPRVPLQKLVEAHIMLAEALAMSDEQPGAARLYQGEAGEATGLFLENLLSNAGDHLSEVNPYSYRKLFETLAAGRMVRPRFGQHPRLSILGPLEARLLSADLMILSGLNEETWPDAAPIDAWLSRPMRAELGLEPPERRIGLSAHDFLQAASAPEVLLTRALKVDGAPTVASRWLLRLDSLLKGLGKTDGLKADAKRVAWAEALDRPVLVKALGAPAPRPPLSARPNQFSVTEIETLIRDPYAIYAKKILSLRALDPLDADAGALERGILLHAALENFARAWPEKLPMEIEAALLDAGRQAFETAPDRPGVEAFWWPRFKRVANWLATWEPKIRDGLLRTHAEISGELLLTGLKRDTKLTAKADRIDEHADHHLAIFDYKTGKPPSKKEVEAGLAPQLPLEAAIARAGGFRLEDGTPLLSSAVANLSYLHLSGKDEGAKEHVVAHAQDDAATRALEGLLSLLAQFEDESTPYLSRPRVQFAHAMSDYDHLARVREWSAADGGGDE